MKLHRLAVVELRPAPAMVSQPPAKVGGVHIELLDHQGVEESAPSGGGLTLNWGRTHERGVALLLVMASIRVEIDPPPRGEPFPVPDGARQAAEQALSDYSCMLSVLAQSDRAVYSPQPYLFLEPTSERERRWIANTRPPALPPLRPGPAQYAPGLATGIDWSTQFADRVTGVSLLSSALSAGGVGRLHELVRIFENAFALSGERLVQPLLDFLRGYPGWNLEYSEEEVKHWIKGLRDPATHADLRIASKVLVDIDVEPHLARIEQAAYDVLFNKEVWHRADTLRRHRWAFAALRRPDGGFIVDPGRRAGLRFFDDLDHFGAFRYAPKHQIKLDLPEGTIHPTG